MQAVLGGGALPQQLVACVGREGWGWDHACARVGGGGGGGEGCVWGRMGGGVVRCSVKRQTSACFRVHTRLQGWP